MSRRVDPVGGGVREWTFVRDLPVSPPIKELRPAGDLKGTIQAGVQVQAFPWENRSIQPVTSKLSC